MLTSLFLFRSFIYLLNIVKYFMCCKSLILLCFICRLQLVVYYFINIDINNEEEKTMEDKKLIDARIRMLDATANEGTYGIDSAEDLVKTCLNQQVFKVNQKRVHEILKRIEDHAKTLRKEIEDKAIVKGKAKRVETTPSLTLIKGILPALKQDQPDLFELTTRKIFKWNNA